MKRNIFLLAISFMSFNYLNGQFADNNAIYASGELNFGNYFGTDFNLNYVLKKKYSFKVGYSWNFRKPKSQPADFVHGLLGPNLFNSPIDQFENFGATVGRIYKLNKSGTIRANISLGIGYTIYTEPENWKKLPKDPLSFGENYSYDEIEHKVVSLIVNPKIEIPIKRHFGFTVSPMLQINKDRTYLGIGFGIMTGLLR